jgi:trehalose 6-phosphate phosphatase
MTAPPPLDPHAALFIDVDGTLVEIAPRPELVQVPSELPSLLDRLARQRNGAVALVSGRRIADLDMLFPSWRGPVAGAHGAERRRADASRIELGNTAVDREAAAALDRLRPALQELFRRSPGMLLEDKGKTVALHYRQAPEKAEELRAFAEALAEAERDRLRLIAGKMVFEFQPRHYGKDGAIAAFMAEPPFRGRVPVFIGDDTTDEDGFAEVNARGGLSIRVGPPASASAATRYLPSVSAVLRWLREGA